MKLPKLIVIAIVFLLAACAERRIDILDKDGKVVGGCIAGYDWHLYGLQASIDYILYKCAKESIEAGLTITDSSLLEKDFSLPAPPEGKLWTKKLAMKHFKEGKVTETKLGYILAELEYQYRLVLIQAERDLEENKITEAKFMEITQKAEKVWKG